MCDQQLDTAFFYLRSLRGLQLSAWVRHSLLAVFVDSCCGAGTSDEALPPPPPPPLLPLAASRSCSEADSALRQC